MVHATDHCWLEILCEMEGCHCYFDISERPQKSNIIEVAEYIISCVIQDEPAFAWWVKFTLCKRDRIIAAVNFGFRKSSLKYGIEIPTLVDNAERIDKKTVTSYGRMILLWKCPM